MITVVGFVASAVLLGFILLKLCDELGLKKAGTLLGFGLCGVMYFDGQAFTEGLLAWANYEAEQATKVVTQVVQSTINSTRPKP